MVVNVGVCSAMVFVDSYSCVDGDWFGTFHAIEGEIPALTAMHAAADPEIAIKLDLQRCLVLFFDKDTILSKEKMNSFKKS